MKHGKTMCSRLMSLGLTKSESTQLLDKLDVLIRHNGEEWTVDHLKEVKLLFLHNLAGTTFHGKHWIARHVDGLPSGPFRALFRLSRKNLSKVLTAFTSYSAYVSTVVTQKQEKKFFSSMCSTDQRGMDARIHHREVITRCPEAPPALFEYCSSSNKRGPGPTGATVPETDVAAIFNHAVESRAVYDLVTEYSIVFREVIPLSLLKGASAQARYDGKEEWRDTFGSISGIQEPGFKLRAVANPSRVIQCVLEPLKRDISLVLKNICAETDFTFNQQGAIPIVQGWLRERRTVYSVDLSDATNLFPWPLQRELLKETLTHPVHHILIDVMDRVTKGSWYTRLRGRPEKVKFTRGQPLGLGPSFGAFALSHNLLLKGICERNGLEPRFCVLGDDVVIADSQLHRIYRKTLDNLGCRVSLSKTFSSKVMAEFAGTTILANRTGHGYKWREMSDFSFIEAARNLGKASLGMMNPYQRAVTNLLSPIPKCFGGLGWSDGRKLSELDSPFYDYAVRHHIDREEIELPRVYRDLVADTNRFCNLIGYSPGSTGLLIGMSGGNKIPISHLIDNRRFNLIKESQFGPMVRPDFLILRDPSLAPPIGYYQWVERVGDPRPSIEPLVRAISYSAKADGIPFDKGITKWIHGHRVNSKNDLSASLREVLSPVKEKVLKQPVRVEFKPSLKSRKGPRF